MPSKFYYYCAVLIVVVSNVVFGLDWQSAPMAPMPVSGPALQVVSTPVPALAPQPPIENQGSAAAANAFQPAAPPAIKCNIAACARAYRSFTASDCSYQPSGGPRRLCAK